MLNNNISERWVIMEFSDIDKISDIKNGTQGVYRVIFTPSVYYIGRSSDIRQRLYEHLSKAQIGEHKNENFNIAYRLYGEPIIKILKTGNDNFIERKLIIEEQPSINKFHPINYNEFDKKSKYIGCTWDNARQCWRSRYKNKHIGYFATEKEASDAYVNAKGDLI